MVEYDVVRCSDMQKFIELVNEKLRKAFFDESADFWEIMAKIRKELKGNKNN